jgi:uncharacterized protein YjbI with pentapeptide repeats
MNEETKQKRLGEQIVGVFGWVRDWWRTNPLASILVMILVAALALITWETGRLGNLGLGEKTYWDWMELLIIPIVLAIGAWWLNKSEKETEREIAKEKRNQDTMEAYFDRMTELLLEHGLADQESRKNEVSLTIARTRTLAVLQSLDGKRKGQVVKFLYESRLITLKHVGWLTGADLTEANLREADLRQVNLRRVNLHRADLTETRLNGANLSETNLSEANLSGASLSVANLTEANLHGASLRIAGLREANLHKADLRKANLRGADLREAHLFGVILDAANLTRASLREANLTNAQITDRQLARAKSLKGAILPDGTKHD